MVDERFEDRADAGRQLARALTDRDLSNQLLAHGTQTALKPLDDATSSTTRT